MFKVSNRSRLFLIMLVGVFVIGFIGTSSAQEKKIKPKNLPAAVKSAFKNEYPNAKIIGASTEKEKGRRYYEIESKDGTVGRDLLYTADGKVTEIEETIPASALPSEVMNSLSKEYPKATIQKAEKLTKGSELTYELKVKIGKKTKEIVFDPAGKIVPKVNDEEEDEKD